MDLSAKMGVQEGGLVWAVRSELEGHRVVMDQVAQILFF